MRKITAIFLCLLFLFNLVGYRIVFNYVTKNLDKQAEALFDNNQYNADETVTITVPLNIPYQTDQLTFERADGKISVDGKIYRYIKRKIVNNEMVLVCVADNNVTKLNKNKNDFFKITSGLFDNSSKKSGSASIGFFKLLTVYNGNALSYNFSVSKILKVHNSTSPYSKLLTLSKKPPVQPPDCI